VPKKEMLFDIVWDKWRLNLADRKAIPISIPENEAESPCDFDDH
jgi:hypothetical protein